MFKIMRRKFMAVIVTLAMVVSLLPALTLQAKAANTVYHFSGGFYETPGAGATYVDNTTGLNLTFTDSENDAGLSISSTHDMLQIQGWSENAVVSLTIDKTDGTPFNQNLLSVRVGIGKAGGGAVTISAYGADGSLIATAPYQILGFDTLVDITSINSIPLTNVKKLKFECEAQYFLIQDLTIRLPNIAPTDISLGTATVAENTASGTAVGTLSTTDVDSGDTFTYSLVAGDGSTDNASFTIDGSTLRIGVTPDYETKSSYSIRVQTADAAGATHSKAFTISVTNIYDVAPVISSGATASVAENTPTATAVYMASGSDSETGDTITWSIGGTDGSLFSINSSTGAVTFKAAPNYENPGDVGTDNVYNVTVTATDNGGLTDTQNVAITVTNINEAPSISSGATVSCAENTPTATAVYTAAGSDADGDTITWSISGTDAGRFSIDSSTGTVTFTAAPDYENPGDVGTDNIYNITITATDNGTLTATKNVAISVTNIYDVAPVITSGATASVAENTPTATEVYMASGSDSETGDTITWSIGGTDGSLFSINSSTGAVTFKVAPNYENPGDVGTDNVYNITVTATDNGGLTDTQNVTITVTNINDAPTISSGATASCAENTPSATVVYTAAGSDADGDTITWSIGGTDAGRFSIDSSIGTVTFTTVPDYENPGDVGTDNIYNITITATDNGTLTATKNVAISVTNIYDVAPVITSGATASVAENTPTATAVYMASGSDLDTGDTITWSIGGTDGSLFSINSSTGAVTFKVAPNYENPGDVGTDNVYNITVTATDNGGLTDTQNVAITVTNINDAPTISSGATASCAENTPSATVVYTAAGSDADGDTITWSISGTDAGLFSIDSSTGAVTFTAAPDYENPGDVGTDNIYNITITATDNGTLTATKNVAISVTNIYDVAPVITSGATASVAENTPTATAVYMASGSDLDTGDTITWSIGGTDGSLFSINSSTGAVTFTAAPDYETPRDAGTDNVYNITVTATDNGGFTDTQNVAITVTNINDAPTISSGETARCVENTATATVVYTAAGSDADGDTITWSISGTDAGLFSIDSSTGAVTFTAAPDYENPGDVGTDNIYNITITATDNGTLSATKNVAISVIQAYTPHTGKGTEIIVNGESQTAGTTETTTDADGRTQTTVTVDTDKLQDILKAQGEGATVTIPVTTASDVAAGVLTGEMVDSMEQKNATLVIQTETATYTLPAEEIDINAVSELFGEDVSLSDITVTVKIAAPSDETVTVVKNAADEGGYSIVVPAVDFTISCEHNGTRVDVSSFNSYVERLIAVPDGVDPEKITTGVVVRLDGTTYHVPTEIVEVDGVYYARINSLTNSTYTVVWHPIEFSDVENHWAKDAINDMGSRMVVYGDESGNYNPDNNMTRAEFAATIVRALGLASGTGGSSFDDINTSDWFCGYVEIAASYGIIEGYGNGDFGPNDTITREQAMAMLARAMNITGLEVTLTDSETNELLGAYSDGTAISDYAVDSIAACLQTGIVCGNSDSTIAPKNCVTRAEVAVMVQRLLQKSELI